MGILEQLKAMVPVETIGGVNVEECAQNVMLDVAFAPVLPYPLPRDPQTGLPDCPVPCRVQQEGSRWCVWLPPDDPQKYQWVSESELKVMRARYLLLKGFFFENIEACDHHSRGLIVSRFFPGGLFKPDLLKNENGTPIYFDR